MGLSTGIVTMVLASLALLATVRWSLPSAPRRVSDVLLAVFGAVLGVGGLLVQSEVGLAAWILTPIAVATIAVLHVRVLFAGSGPLRT
jgi:hypothetical protein